MTKIKRLQKRMIENINYTYRIFLLFFSVLMAVFLTSKMWLPNDVSIRNTAIGTSLSTSDSIAVCLQSWQYNSASRFMEATFTYQKSDSLNGLQFLAAAHADTNKVKALDVSVPYNNNGFFVVQIRNVPQNWNVISMWIDSKQEQPVGLMQNDSGYESNTDSTGAAMRRGANFFCDVRKVVQNNALKSQSSLYYSLKSIDNEISTVKTHMTQTNKKITAANLSIQQLTSDITALNDNEKYQTAEEVKQSKDAIQSKTAQINDLKSSISQFRSDIKNDQLKLQKLRQKWNDTRDGKYKDTSESATKSVPSSSSSPSLKSSVSSAEKVTVD